MNWQPIETAPKEGKILGYTPRIGVNIFWWSKQEFHKNPRPFWNRDTFQGTNAIRATQPTHWAPIPEGPK